MSDQTARKTYHVQSIANFPVSVIGRVVRDLELRYTPAGVAVTDINLVVSRPYQSNDEWKEETTFVRFSLWRDAAERANSNLHKGDVVNVQFNMSSLTARPYESGGEQRASLEGTALAYRKVAGSTDHDDVADATIVDDGIPF